MLGYHIFILRQLDGGAAPATADSETVPDLGMLFWEGYVDAIHWIDDLARSGDAIDWGGTGYPFTYTAKASVVRRHMPGRDTGIAWNFGPEKVGEDGNPILPESVLDDLPPDEWLKIEAWDRS